MRRHAAAVLAALALLPAALPAGDTEKAPPPAAPAAGEAPPKAEGEKPAAPAEKAGAEGPRETRPWREADLWERIDRGEVKLPPEARKRIQDWRARREAPERRRGEAETAREDPEEAARRAREEGMWAAEKKVKGLRNSWFDTKEADRPKIEEELKAAVAALFDLREKRRAEELAKQEADLKEAQAKLEEQKKTQALRAEHKDEIVKRRLDEILEREKEDPLKW